MQKKVVNNKDEIPLKHYMEQFAELDPAERAKELGLEYVNDTFTVTMFGATYQIHWPEATFSCDDERAIAMISASGKIMLLRYLIGGKTIPTSGAYKTFRELPWGEIYLQTFNGRCIMRLAYKFNGNKARFAEGAKALGGIPLEHGDAGFYFDFIGDYHLQIFLWEADEEFPPNAQIEFSDNFALGFSAEDAVVAAELLISAISEKMKMVKIKEA